MPNAAHIFTNILIDWFAEVAQQDVDPDRAVDNVAIYNAHISYASHMENAASFACRSPLSRHGVVLLSIANDVREMDSRSKQRRPKHVTKGYLQSRERRRSYRNSRLVYGYPLNCGSVQRSVL